MARKEFKVQEIGEIDGGRPAAAINRDIRQAVADCLDRPGDDSRRKVVIEIEVTPNCTQEGFCEDVDIELTTVAKVPRRRSRPVNMRADVKGNLIWNEASRDDVHQGTIDEETGEVDD